MVRPREAMLSADGAARVWSAVGDTVSSKIYGPHPETLARRWTGGPVKLLCFGRNGATAELAGAAAARPDVELVDLDRLYHGT